MSNVYKQKEEYLEEISVLSNELHKYQTALDMLLVFWDCIPDEHKPMVHKKLKELEL